MFRASQIDHRVVAGNKCRMNRVRRKKITIAGAQGVSFMPDAQCQFTADDPMRLIFGVRVWSVLRAGGVAPLKNAVAFALQPLPQFIGIRLVCFAPSFNFNAHAGAILSRRTSWSGPIGLMRGSLCSRPKPAPPPAHTDREQYGKNQRHCQGHFDRQAQETAGDERKPDHEDDDHDRHGCRA